MKARDLRDLTDDELAAKLGERRQELFNLRFQSATGALENSARLRLGEARDRPHPDRPPRARSASGDDSRWPTRRRSEHRGRRDDDAGRGDRPSSRRSPRGRGRGGGACRRGDRRPSPWPKSPSPRRRPPRSPSPRRRRARAEEPSPRKPGRGARRRGARCRGGPAEEPVAEEAPAEEPVRRRAVAEEARPSPSAEAGSRGGRRACRARAAPAQAEAEAPPARGAASARSRAREKPASASRSPGSRSPRASAAAARSAGASSSPTRWTRRSSSRSTPIKAHRRYKKVVRRSTKFHAHDEQNRPRSATSSASSRRARSRRRSTGAWPRSSRWRSDPAGIPTARGRQHRRARDPLHPRDGRLAPPLRPRRRRHRRHRQDGDAAGHDEEGRGREGGRRAHEEAVRPRRRHA